MGGRYLHGTRTELFVDVVVGNDGHQATLDKRVHGFFADEVLVPFILRVDGDTRITEHSFWPGGSNLDRLVAALNLGPKTGRGIGPSPAETTHAWGYR